MPQCNFYTFLSQTTWTIILLLLFYFIMKQYFLPLIFENIKLKYLIKLSIPKSPIKKSSDYYNYYNNKLIE